MQNRIKLIMFLCVSGFFNLSQAETQVNVNIDENLIEDIKNTPGTPPATGFIIQYRQSHSQYTTTNPCISFDDIKNNSYKITLTPTTSITSISGASCVGTGSQPSNPSWKTTDSGVSCDTSNNSCPTLDRNNVTMQ